jgi:2-polyprenyl-3-methyl-5-hydroxy-6-metoxy-1,4-benzoquinol methylase
MSLSPSPRLGRGANQEYYLEYNAQSLSFPRNIFHAPKFEWAKRLAESLPGRSRVLDAGCGAGLVSAPLTAEHQVTGVDIEDEAIAYCRKSYPGTYLIAPLQQLPFPDEHFDLIFFTNTIEHLAEPSPILGELQRVLALQGKMLVTTENCANLFWLFLEQTWYRFFGGPCKPYQKEVHPQRYTPQLLRDHLQPYFNIERMEERVLGMELVVIAKKQGTA